MFQKIYQRFSRYSFTQQVLIVTIISLFFSGLLGYWFGKIYFLLFRPVFFGQLFNPFPQDRGGVFIGFLSAFLFFFPFFVLLLLPKKQKSVIIKGVTLPFLLFLLNGLQYSLFALFLISGGAIIGYFLRVLRG